MPGRRRIGARHGVPGLGHGPERPGAEADERPRGGLRRCLLVASSLGATSLPGPTSTPHRPPDHPQITPDIDTTSTPDGPRAPDRPPERTQIDRRSTPERSCIGPDIEFGTTPRVNPRSTPGAGLNRPRSHSRPTLHRPRHRPQGGGGTTGWEALGREPQWALPEVEQGSPGSGAEWGAGGIRRFAIKLGFGRTLALHWYCTTAPAPHLCCTGTAGCVVAPSWYCTGTRRALCLYGTGTTPVLRWRCLGSTSAIPVHHQRRTLVVPVQYLRSIGAMQT